MKRYDLKEENGSFVLLELRPVPVATFAERALAELVRELLEDHSEFEEWEASEDRGDRVEVRAHVTDTHETLAEMIRRAERHAHPETLHDEAGTLIRHVARNGIVVRKMSDEEVEMMEAGGLLKPGAPQRAEPEADHETETGAAPEGEAPRGGEGAPRLFAAPAEAEAAEAGASAPSADEPPSWEALHARGLTAREAAEARDCGVGAAYVWSSKNGVKWAPATPPAPDPAAQPAPAPRPAADLKGWTQEDLDAALLQVEEGGKVEAVADEYGAPAHVLRSHWMKRLAAKREAAGLPLRTNGATAREDAEAGR